MRGQRLRGKQGLCFRALRGLGRQQPHRKRSSGGARDCRKETERSGMFVSRMDLNLTAINSFTLWPLLLTQGNNHKPQGGTSLLAVWGLDLSKPASFVTPGPGLSQPEIRGIHGTKETDTARVGGSKAR